MGYLANQAALELLFRISGKIKERIGNGEGKIVMTKQEYVKQVVKKLHCRQEKKNEIERQLLSDIEIALEEGRNLEEILAEMGEPDAVAKEFNESFGEGSAGEQPKKSRAWIIVTAVLVVLAVLIGAAYWAVPKSGDINKSKVFKEETVRQCSEEVVEAFSAKDYDKMFGYFSQAMREAVTVDMLEDSRQYIGEDWGEYRGIGNVYIAEISQQGKKYAMSQLSGVYENVGVTFTLTFDSDMQLVGFYMK